MKRTALAGVAFLICALPLACGKDKDKPAEYGDRKGERATPQFYVQGTCAVIDMLGRELPERNGYGVLAAADKLGRVLEGLPMMLARGKDTISRWEDRKQHAEEAHKFFLERVKPGLLVDDDRIRVRLRKYDVEEMNARLKELAEIVGRVANP